MSDMNANRWKIEIIVKRDGRRQLTLKCCSEEDMDTLGSALSRSVDSKRYFVRRVYWYE